MKNPIPYACDGCGAPKTASNNWWVVFAPTNECFDIYHWESTDPDGEGALHLCSEGCVSKKLSAWMGLKPKTRLNLDVEIGEENAPPHDR